VILRSDGDVMKAKTFHDNCYGFRIFDRSTATTKLLVMEWSHPNYGHWSDFAIFVRGMRREDTEVIRFDHQAPNSFKDAKKDFPEFKEFFKIMEGPFFGDFDKLMRVWRT